MRPAEFTHPRAETAFQRNRPTPDRLNNSLRRSYDLLRSALQTEQGTQYLVEGELTDALSASRNTVRMVLRQLAKEGMVTRGPKRGTYSAPQILMSITDLGPVDECGPPGQRIQTHLRTLEYQTVGCPALIRERLQLPPDWTVLMVESLLTEEDGSALGLTTGYIALTPELSDGIVVDEPHPIPFLEKTAGVRIAKSHTTIGAIAAEGQSAALVGVALGAPMVFLDDVFQDENGRAWAIFQSRLRSDRIAFSAQVQRPPA